MNKYHFGASLGRWLTILTGCLALTGTSHAATSPSEPSASQTGMLAGVFPAIVRIEVIRLRPSDGLMTKAWTAGSGAIISAEGHILTNCHVSEDADSFRCYLYDGQQISARRVGQDPLTDLAVLQLDLTQWNKNSGPLPVAHFGDSERLVSGDTVFALGSPGFLSQSVTRGIVANPSLVMPELTVGKMMIRGEDVGTLVRWILHDAQIFHGNSGGPLINAKGEIVGVNEIGVFNLGGAIPSNLARAVAEQLIAHGRVTRGWSGLTVQPRLEADGNGQGVMVADVAPDSPAAKAGFLSGDVLLACDGIAIEGAEEKAVAHFYRLETGRLPGNAFKLDYRRGTESRQAQITLAAREPARADDVELRSWGAVVCNLTMPVVRNEQLPDVRGILLENIRPAGPCGQAEPELRRGDIIIAVDGQPVGDVAELRTVTNKFFPDTESALVHPVTASFRRDGAVLSSVVELRNTNPRRITPIALKAWLGVASQPLTPKLNKRLGINSADGGARLTRIYPGTEAEKAGLLVGDVILAIDGSAVTARRAEDSDVLARQIRQYKAGTSAAFSLWRDGKKIDLPVLLEAQPRPPAEMPWWEDIRLEFSVHELAFDDRVRLQLAPNVTGVVVESATPAGWAELAGLRGDDLVLTAGGTAVKSVEDLHRLRDEAVRSEKSWWVLQVQRRGQTLFVEINLKPAKK